MKRTIFSVIEPLENRRHLAAVPLAEVTQLVHVAFVAHVAHVQALHPAGPVHEASQETQLSWLLLTQTPQTDADTAAPSTPPPTMSSPNTGVLTPPAPSTAVDSLVSSAPTSGLSLLG